MREPFDPLSDHACRMTHAYKTGIELRETLGIGACLRAAVSEVTIYTDQLEDGHPNWHPALDSFRGMLQPFVTSLTVDDETDTDRRSAKRRIRRYEERAGIENAYKKIKDLPPGRPRERSRCVCSISDLLFCCTVCGC